jgi:NTP pyrophosphatase (non-canonical NTP hydrolase)
MTLLEPVMAAEAAAGATLTTVLCGSFRRDPMRLRRTFETLRSEFEVLSPMSLDFVDPAAEFVRLEHELDEPEADVERRHLDAIGRADFVWLHAPDGYVGTSAAMELGHASAQGVAIYSDTRPTDPVLASLVVVVASPDGVPRYADRTTGDPGTGVGRLQRYYATVASRRGWAGESARDTMLLMTEELGELARAVRLAEGIDQRRTDAGSNLAEELADVQLYLVHLANTLGIDLADAVTRKEAINSARFEQRLHVA